MGVTTGVRCIDCDLSAPELGDFGHIGLPSSSTEARKGEMQNIGYLFLGFRAIGMVTGELVDLLEFTEAHEGHRLAMFADDEEEEFDPETYSDEDEFDEDWDDDDEDEDEDEDEDDGPERSVALVAEMASLKDELAAPRSDASRADFVIAHYELACGDCNEAFRTEFTDAVQPMPELTIGEARAALFLDIVRDNEDSFYRAHPFSPDDLAAVADFLDEHLGHSVIARLVLEDEAA